MPEVRVGQLWQDNDRRIDPDRRMVRIVEVGSPGPNAVQVVTWYEQLVGGEWIRKTAQRPGTIRLSRFVPISTGYRLIEEAAA